MRDKLVVFLQNSWSPVYAGTVWPRPSWMRALERGRSGQRLRLMIDDLEVVENTTPITGDSASSRVPPDLKYIEGILSARQPELVIACGDQAQRCLAQLWAGDLIGIPHPAYRFLDTGILRVARTFIELGVSGRVKLWQPKGQKTILIEPIT